MENLLITAAISFAATVLLGLVLIPLLRKIKVGQTILEIGPSWHMAKQGTPTMGGLMFMIGITVAVLIMGWYSMAESRYIHLFVLLFGWLFGAIGFVDDFYKVARKQNKGLSAIQKLALQSSVAVAFLALLRLLGYLKPDLYLPFFSLSIPLGWILFLMFSIILVVGMVNAVNLTDGVDGLCGSITLPIAIFFAAIAYAWNRPEVALVAAALAGAMLGFLVYNFHPAKVFMGDTGSLFLGGMVCGLGFAVDAPMLILIAGIVYLCEAASVMLQVFYFKVSGGKRLFKMAPIHHHFEKSGWSEVTICLVFTLVTLVLCGLTYAAVVNRF